MTARKGAMSAKARSDHRLGRSHMPSLKSWGPPASDPTARELPRNVIVDCGWGRLIFAHTFADNRELADTLRHERTGERDIALYLRDPHVVLALAPQELFLDPSHTYRLWLDRYRPARSQPRGFIMRKFRTLEDAEAINRIFAARHMVPIDPDFLRRNRNSRSLTFFVAEDSKTGRVIGTVAGVDHKRAFDDPENGASLWCLGVDPQTPHPGVGEALVRHLAEHFLARGRSFMDLSVMYDNDQAIKLYEKLGFQRVPVFCVKKKNPINEPLFMGPAPEQALNPYASIIVDEARRRGIAVEVLDVEANYFALTFGGRTIVCRESLSELTSAVAMSRCDDKAVTRRLLARAGLRVPDQVAAAGREENAAFLARHGRVVVKPVRGEQGVGVSVDLTTPEEVEAAVERARQTCDHVLLEQFVEGEDLRIIVIGFQMVAAAARRAPQVVGDGRHTVAELINILSRRRAAATEGESRVPIDDETLRCVKGAGFEMDSVLPKGVTLEVRRTANLHTGGTIHDVTPRLHPRLAEAAERAARAIDIPVVGLDLLVPSVEGPDYVIVEANERPGLANHEPQPTAERFVDLLFPQTATAEASPA